MWAGMWVIQMLPTIFIERLITVRDWKTVQKFRQRIGCLPGTDISNNLVVRNKLNTNKHFFNDISQNIFPPLLILRQTKDVWLYNGSNNSPPTAVAGAFASSNVFRDLIKILCFQWIEEVKIIYLVLVVLRKEKFGWIQDGIGLNDLSQSYLGIY